MELRGGGQAFAGEVEVVVGPEEEDMVQVGEGEDEPEVIKLIDTVHPNISSLQSSQQ